MNLNYRPPLLIKIDEQITKINHIEGFDPLGTVVKNKFQTEIAQHLTSLHDNTVIDSMDELRKSSTTVGTELKTSVDLHKKIFLDIGRTASCTAFIFNSVSKPLTENDIQLFYELLFDDPSYRDKDVRLTTQEGDEFVFSQATNVEKELKELLLKFFELRKNENVHPLTKIAYFHYEFLKIHPFLDGNGRISRLLMNISLMSFGYLPILIAVEDRVDYFSALDQCNKGNLNSLVDFLTEKEWNTIQSFTSSPEYISILAKQELSDKISKLQGAEKCVVLTEDKNYEEGLVAIFESSGFNLTETKFLTYEGCSKIDSVALYTIITKDKFPHITVIVHRDRDYLTEEEIDKQAAQFAALHQTEFFVTIGTDVESHFVNAEHINICHPELSVSAIQQFIDDSVKDGRALAIDRLRTKEFGQSHKNKSSHLSKALEALYDDNPFRFTVGKPLFKAVKNKIQAAIGKNPILNKASKSLTVPLLTKISESIWRK